jgi:hypothetical protein
MERVRSAAPRRGKKSPATGVIAGLYISAARTPQASPADYSPTQSDTYFLGFSPSSAEFSVGIEPPAQAEKKA